MTLYRAYLGNMYNGPVYYWATSYDKAFIGGLRHGRLYNPPFDGKPQVEKVKFKKKKDLCKLLNFQQEQFERGEHRVVKGK